MKIKTKISILGAAAILTALCGCQQNPPSNEELWKAAITDAVFSEDSEVFELVALTKDDERVIWDDEKERVLLLTWHNYDSECLPGDALDASYIWATSLGEMKKWYKESGSSAEDWNLRLAQLLGVHENEGYTRFTAFWVLPEDVIRPAYITDVTKQMENGYEKVTDKAYKEWFDGNILYSYFESDYPWTRLGYTYDWSGGASEYGLSEFLVKEGSKCEIVFTCTTDKFKEWLENPEL